MSKKTEPKYACEPCDFGTCDLKDFRRHCDTKKHNDNTTITKKPNDHVCGCGHAYKFASGLSRHKKVCPGTALAMTIVQAPLPKKPFGSWSLPAHSGAGAGADMDDSESDSDSSSGFDSDSDSDSHSGSDSDSDADTEDGDGITVIPIGGSSHPHSKLTKSNTLITARTDVVRELKKANSASNSIDKASRLENLVEKLLLETKELRDMVAKQTEISLEREARLFELASRPTTVVNNKVSIVNYLNTECKDAMSLSDFVNTLQVTMDDMYYTRDNGYVKGMCNVFAKGIENLKQTERPIHCTDKKRLKFFIKRDEKWERDDKHSEIGRVMNNITEKHIAQLQKWKEEHPDWINKEELRDEFIAFTSRIFEAQGKNGEKTMRNVIKNLGDFTEVKL